MESLSLRRRGATVPIAVPFARQEISSLCSSQGKHFISLIAPLSSSFNIKSSVYHSINHFFFMHCILISLCRYSARIIWKIHQTYHQIFTIIIASSRQKLHKRKTKQNMYTIQTSCILQIQRPHAGSAVFEFQRKVGQFALASRQTGGAVRPRFHGEHEPGWRWKWICHAWWWVQPNVIVISVRQSNPIASDVYSSAGIERPERDPCRLESIDSGAVVSGIKENCV